MRKQNELLRALRKGLAAKERELADQKWVFEQFLKSPSWRLTRPLRWAAGLLRGRRNGNSPAPLPPAEAAEEAAPVSGAEVIDEVRAAFTSLSLVSLENFLAAGSTLTLPQSGTPVLSIIVVAFNRAELTLACLRSIAETREAEIEVVVVDNASTDSTPALLERVRNVRLIRNGENRHFLRAVNQAAAGCSGEFLVLLNSDAQLHPGALGNALDTLRSGSSVGAVGGKIILMDGSLQEAGSIVWRDGSCLGYGRGDDPMAAPYMYRRDVDYCSAAFLMTPRSVWERLGGFDEVFNPAYYEETDYCMRLRAEGFRVVYEPGAAVTHYEFASSESSSRAIDLQRAHQKIFSERHAAALALHESSGEEHIVRARARTGPQRVLFLDDRVPHGWLGSGFPRAHAFLMALLKHGCFVTQFPVAVIDEPWDVVYTDIPREVEVMMGMGGGVLEAFLRNRQGYYTAIVVSRPHNMQLLAPILRDHPEWFTRTHVIYDAEALFFSRDAGSRRLEGNPMSAEEAKSAHAAEIQLTSAADCVVSVSESEKGIFMQHGSRRVEVLGHSIEIDPAPADFENRTGLLFVGAVHKEDSPNADSLIWFLSKVFPRIQAELGPDVRLTIAGVNTSQRVRDLAGPSVSITGHLRSLRNLYAGARIFVAPTRYGAGIPHKVHEAAAQGLPVVATPLLAGQLHWTEREIAIGENPEEFAAQCVEVYRNRGRWESLREAALERARVECSPEAFERRVWEILKR